MLEALSKLPLIKKAITKSINNDKVTIITDNESRLELGVNNTNLVIRLFFVHKNDKIKMKSSLYVVINGSSLPLISKKALIHNGSEVIVPVVNGKSDIMKQLHFIKGFSNFMNTL